MAEVIRMPRMSDTMEEGNIVGWLKEVGESVEPGDVLAEVETDKATMELESFHEGVLLHIGIKEGPVPVNGILAVIGEAGEDFSAALKAAESAEPKSESEAVKESVDMSNSHGSAPKAPSPSPIEQPIQVSEASTSSTNGSRLKASPLAKSMATEAGIDLSSVTGSGENGRIVKRDVEAAIQNPSKVAPTKAEVSNEINNVPAFNFSSTDQFQDTPVSQMRKVIARRLGESKFSAPHFYLTMEIDMTKAIAVRKSINEMAPPKISFNDLVVKGCAAALQQNPAINSSWLGDRIRTNSSINIGVAVAVDDGLLVPVIRHANMKSLSQINIEVKELAGRAKIKKLQPDEMSGNTFTISNLGMFGIDEFTAIINPPDACILAVGGISQQPVVRDGEIAVGNIMKVTLSCDHRVVDGFLGGSFLRKVGDELEAFDSNREI